MSTNAELVAIFTGIADLLDLTGEKFKPEAYRRAGRSLEALTEDVRKVADRGGLDEIPGVGEAISEKIREYLKTGKIEYYERLRQSVPPGLVEIMQLPGLGPKTARRFYLELKVEGPAELAEAIRQGRLTGLKGFGPRKIELIQQALGAASGTKGRTPTAEAYAIALAILDGIRGSGAVDQAEIAGSLRRRRESVGDLDLLITSQRPEAVFDTFSTLPGVAKIVLRGPTKETIIWSTGIQVDLRVVEPKAFGAALVYFTGSKDHNIHLRSLARDQGLKVNEYGVFRGEELVGGSTEEDVYRTLGLPVMPPEVRENQGEIEAAQKGEVPQLVDTGDLHGLLHRHLPDGPVGAGVRSVLQDSVQRRHDYVALVLSDRDPSPADVRAAIAEAAKATGFDPSRVLVGVELPASDGPGAKGLPDGADFWVAVPEGSGGPPHAPGKGAPGPTPWFVAHLDVGAGDAGGDAGARGAWVDWARQAGTALEVSPDAPKDGLDSAGVRRAVAAQVDLVIRERLLVGEGPDLLPISTGFARRGWAPPERVVNARGWAALRPRSTGRRSAKA